MAKKVDAASVRSSMANDLLALARVVQEETAEVVKNPEILKSSANQLDRATKAATWSYDVVGLQMQVAVPQNTLPFPCGNWLDIKLDLNIGGKCTNDSEEDCVTDLVLNLEIATETRQNLCSWHFDRHIGETGDVGDDGDVHPLYHFQHGGHAMKPFAESLGSSLLLPAPRLAFPPMDAALSLDFVLSNFSGKSWRRLRNNSTYSRVLRTAQERHWRPYLKRLAAWWEPGRRDSTGGHLWPHLI